jgi:hypothetical protein
MQSNFTVLVTGEGFSGGVPALSALGATTFFEPMDTVLGTIRQGATSRVCADVIVVDGTASRENILSGDGVLRAVRLTEALATLSDIYVMSNGVRWSALPIVLVGRDDALGSLLRYDPKFKHVDYVPLLTGPPSRSPWSVVYERAQRRYLRFGRALAESVNALGVLLHHQRGQMLRAGLREGVRLEAVENALYAGRHDQWFRTHSSVMRQIFSPLFSGRDAVARAVVEMERLAFDRTAKEDRPEALVRLNPCLMDIARFEAFPQFSFVGSDGKRYRVDLLRLSYGEEHGRPASEIVEFKRGGYPLLRHRAFATLPSEGVMQTAEYVEHLAACRAEIERRLGARLGTLRRTVVGGYARGADPVRLSRAREAATDTSVLGLDDLAGQNRQRFRIPAGWEPDSAA